MKIKVLLLFIFIFSPFALTAFAQKILILGLRFETETNYDNAEWRWTPTATFRLTGPVSASANISVEYTTPNGVPWVTAKCKLWNAIESGKNFRFDYCGKDIEPSKATNQTGMFKFQIKLNDPANGTNQTLYSGRFSIGKILYNIDGTPAKNKQFHYFVDNDFRLGYAFVATWFGDTTNDLYTEVWLKNKIMNYAAIQGYLYYKGKQIAETSGSFPLKLHPKENAKESFELVGFQFPVLMNQPDSNYFNDRFKIYKNPGDYEIKVMRDDQLIRSIKFSVDAGGKIAANNIGKEIVDGTSILTPVQILGTADGTYNKTAWKDGIFGNPISNLFVP